MNSRRSFLKKLGLGAAAPFVLQKQAHAFGHSGTSVNSNPGPKTSLPPYAILQSATSETETTIVLVVPRIDLVTFEIREVTPTGEEPTKPPFRWNDVSLYPHEESIYQLSVSELDSTKTYELLCFSGSELKDVRVFKSLQRTNGKFAAISCSNQNIKSPQKGIWKSLLTQDIDAIFYLGDSVYANSALDTVFGKLATPEKAYERYIETFKSLPLYRTPKLTPVFNIWDDHDYASNNGDRHHPYKLQMQKIFRCFFPVEFGPELENGPGVSFAISYMGCRYYFLDDRSFRDYSETDSTRVSDQSNLQAYSIGKPLSENQLFGEEQKNWVEKSLQKNSLPSVLILGSQIFGFGWNRDSVEANHPQEIKWLQKLTQSYPHSLTFITGDVHFSHVQQLSANDFGYSTFEFTSSAMHSYSVQGWGKRGPESGQLHYFGWANYNIFSIRPYSTREHHEPNVVSDDSLNVQTQALGQGLRIQVACRDANDKTQYENTFIVQK